MCSTCVLLYVPNTSVSILLVHSFIYLFFMPKSFSSGFNRNSAYRESTRVREREGGFFSHWTISACATGKRRSKNKSFRIFNVLNTHRIYVSIGQYIVHRSCWNCCLQRWHIVGFVERKFFFCREASLRACVCVAWTTTIKTTTMASGPKALLNKMSIGWFGWIYMKLEYHHIILWKFVAMCWMKLKFAP